MNGFALGTHVQIKTEKGSVYNNVTGVIISRPVTKEECEFIEGWQKVKFDCLVHTGERYVAMDIFHPNELVEIG